MVQTLSTRCVLASAVVGELLQPRGHQEADSPVGDSEEGGQKGQQPGQQAGH